MFCLFVFNPFKSGVLQFAVGGVLALLMWTFSLHEKPKVSKDTVRDLAKITYVLTTNSTPASMTCLSPGRTMYWGRPED